MKPNYSFYIFLVYVSFFSTLVPAITGFFRIKYLGAREKALFYLILVSLVSESVIFILRELNIRNLYVARIYDVMEFTLISLFYIRLFDKSKITLYMKILVFVFIGIAILDFYYNGISSMDDIFLTTESILFMIYSLFAFFHLLQNPVYDNVLAAPLFWFNTAILTYFSGNLFLFVFSNYLENHFAKVSPALWGIHSLLNIVFYFLISTGFWKTATQRT